MEAVRLLACQPWAGWGFLEPRPAELEPYSLGLLPGAESGHRRCCRIPSQPAIRPSDHRNRTDHADQKRKRKDRPLFHDNPANDRAQHLAAGKRTAMETGRRRHAMRSAKLGSNRNERGTPQRERHTHERGGSHNRSLLN